MTTILHTQNLSNKQMKKTYLMPAIELEELIVENGIAQSLSFGYEGIAGQEGDYIESGVEL
ncbi:MAG: hypothetical protein IJD12_01575 [Tidjanibacter sp.]|nr:hypothetical protein [Tidjanibacter sp.]